MKQLAEQLGLSDGVTFFGYVPHADVPDALRSMDIFCAPSTRNSESFGIHYVTSDAEGFTEVMENGVTGFIVPKEDIDALAEKLAY